MPFADLREFVERLRSAGELVALDEQVDWNLEIGALTRLGLDDRGPALLFENVKDYPGSRALGNVLGPSKPIVQGKVALAMDLSRDTPTDELVAEFRRRARKPLAPRRVDTAPCKQNVLKGDDVDMLMFPAPLLHEGDGGRMIGTWHVTVTRDPDTGWVNWGTYRHQLHSRNTCGFLAHPGQHGPWIYYQKYEARNEPMPMAIVIGCEPVTHMLAASQPGPGVSEAEVVGAIRGAPVETVRCETLDLDVPASAEIVIEGHVLPHERELEGGFGEYTGFYAGGRFPRPVFRAECITFRDNPIFTVSNPGKPWDEYHVLSSVTMSALLMDELHARGVPARQVYVPGPATTILVSVKPQYAGYVQTVASAVWSTKPGLYRPYLMVFDDDIDVTNLEEVFWALTTRLHPGTGIHVVHNAPAHPLYPYISDQERRERRTDRVALDCTWPTHWPAEDIPRTNDFEHAWPADVRETALGKWHRALAAQDLVPSGT
jgi:phenylphosphate carboxylase alpha subunit